MFVRKLETIFPTHFLIFFFVEGKSFLYDLAWTVSGPCLWVSRVVDPGVLYFPQTLFERAVHFQVLHGGVKFSWGSLCLALLQAHNPSGSKCLELKRLQAFLREYLNSICQTTWIKEIYRLCQQYIKLAVSCFLVFGLVKCIVFTLPWENN